MSNTESVDLPERKMEITTTATQLFAEMAANTELIKKLNVRRIGDDVIAIVGFGPSEFKVMIAKLNIQEGLA